MWKQFSQTLERNKEWRAYRHAKAAGDILAYFGVYKWIASMVGVIVTVGGAIWSLPIWAKLLLGLLSIPIVLLVALVIKLLLSKQATDDDKEPTIVQRDPGVQKHGRVKALSKSIGVVVAVILAAVIPELCTHLVASRG
jgi:membrane protein implicated in regulation of membrane protease activity